MNRYINIFLFFVLLLPVGEVLADPARTSIVQQCSANGVDYNKAVVWVAKLQWMLKNNDKQLLAKTLNYPVRINKGAKHYWVRNEKDFVKQYSIIFGSKIKRKIINTASSDIFCNAQGAMIADGTVWFGGEPLKIFSLNLM